MVQPWVEYGDCREYAIEPIARSWQRAPVNRVAIIRLPAPSSAGQTRRPRALLNFERSIYAEYADRLLRALRQHGGLHAHIGMSRGHTYSDRRRSDASRGADRRRASRHAIRPPGVGGPRRQTPFRQPPPAATNDK